MGKPDPQDLLRLADEVAAAPAEMQAVMLDRAWEALAKDSAEFRAFATAPSPSFGTNAGKFSMMMDAHAYESAAMMLVPEGMSWSLTDPANADGSRSIFGYPSRCHAQVEGGPHAHDYGATPALALCNAALRAHSTKESDNG